MSLLGRLLGRRPSGFDARDYWENRYASGGTSGDGSIGRLAEFKGDYLNTKIAETGASSVIEFGCGDGDQLELLEVERYIGLDVSASVIQRCAARFRDDRTKSFFLYDSRAFHDPGGIFLSDIAMSIDVTYHIVDEEVLQRYYAHLFGAARKAVILYTTDFDRTEAAHIRHRRPGPYLEKFSPDFRLVETVPNKYPGSGHQESDAKFFLYLNHA